MNVCAIAALVVGAAIQAASGPAIWAGLTAGPYRVGLSRIDRGGLEVTYWHPSTAGGEPMRLRDFALDADGFVKDAEDRGLPAAAAADYLDSPLHARLNAPRASGRFPLVLVGQGNGQGPLDQAVLAEFLASRGFVVATTPSPAIRSPMRSADDVGPLAQRQAEELRRAARLLDEQGVADVSRSAAVGHSFGARAALLLAMQERQIKALASLDGGIGTAQAIESFRRAPWFDSHRARVPILHFYETADPFMAPDFTLLRGLPSAELTLREVHGLHHVHFTTLGFGAALDPRIRAVTRMEPQGPAALQAVATELAAFLERHVVSRPR